MEPPTKVTKLRPFLGLVNYYWQFINGYSAIANPLTDFVEERKGVNMEPRVLTSLRCLEKGHHQGTHSLSP